MKTKPTLWKNLIRRHRGVAALLALLVGCALVVAICGPAACTGDDKDDKKNSDLSPIPGEGVLPLLETGDRWVQRGVMQGTEYTLTTEVIGEEMYRGSPCYLVEGSTDPPAQGYIATVRGLIDKATLMTVQIEASGEHEGAAYDVTTGYSRTFSTPPYPLTIGKEWAVTEEMATATGKAGETAQRTDAREYTTKVEAMEDITVPAGTFRCFRVTKYDASGTLLETSWISDQTKHFDVKKINNRTDETMQLISYSVSQ